MSENSDYIDAPSDPNQREEVDANALRTIETTQSVPPLPSPGLAPSRTTTNNRLHVPGNSGSIGRNRSSSIRIRRLPSSSTINRQSQASPVPDIHVSGEGDPDVTTRDYAQSPPQQQNEEPTGRRRSFSAPERREDVMAAAAAAEQGNSRPNSRFMPIIQEGQVVPGTEAGEELERTPSGRLSRPPLFGRLRSGYRSAEFGNSRRTSRRTSSLPDEYDNEYDNEVANVLDVMDPEISALTTLTNVQNSLFIPDLSIGRFSLLNRRPTYTLSQRPAAPTTGYDTDTTDEYLRDAEEIASTTGPQDLERPQTRGEGDTTVQGGLRRSRAGSITSQLSESRYAVLPHGADLSTWSKEDRDAINDHVRHMMHSRRSKMKRGWKGFLQYIRRPLGFFVTLYAFLITVFGLIWVLFLIGWISGGNDARHKYLINVVDNVLVALFAVVGDGLAPFRAVDTYHMLFISHYARLTWKRRKEKRLPKLENRNELPTLTEFDVENPEEKKEELSVLSPTQQRRLAHHQKKFARSHTYYKPHETTTHYAFSIRLLITITVLLDCHSLLQISLGACTWGWDWHTRPAVVTTVILICSITCNIMGGIMISVGDRRSRKTEVVEQIFRQQLTEEAIKKVERHKKRDAEKKEEEERKSFSADRPERKSLNFIRPERKSFTANRLSASSPSASGNLENPKAYEGT